MASPDAIVDTMEEAGGGPSGSACASIAAWCDAGVEETVVSAAGWPGIM